LDREVLLFCARGRRGHMGANGLVNGRDGPVPQVLLRVTVPETTLGHHSARVDSLALVASQATGRGPTSIARVCNAYVCSIQKVGACIM
jgi:hypothetical protein